MKNGSYRVQIITCPECGHEKTKLNLRKKCMISYTCKKCKHVCDPNKHMKQFRFRGIAPTNSHASTGVLQ